MEVKPITVPQPNGAMKLGAGAAEATPKEVSRAAETTRRFTSIARAETSGRERDSPSIGPSKMLGTAWTLVKNSVYAFIGDEALTRGVAIAFYTVTSIGPVLFIVVAIAGLTGLGL